MAEQNEAQEKSADLTIQDLSSLKQIIDVASQRGAFKPSEYQQVGQTYSKLEAFLNEIARQQEEAKADEEGTEAKPAVAEETPQGE